MMYDVIIVGGGPAGVTAAIYAARYKLSTLLLSPEIGGWAKKAYKIENLTSYASILGKELSLRYEEHIKANDITYKKETVMGIEKSDAGFVVKSTSGLHNARFLIYAAGTRKRKLNVPGEDKFLGKGVCLCATCDAPFFKNKRVAVIGGNDSGATSALLVAEYAEKVMLFEIMDSLPCEPIWREKMFASGKIEVVCGDSVSRIEGDKKVERILLKSGRMINVDGVFIEVGSDPNSEMARAIGAETDKWGHIVVDRSQHTSVDGLYAAGDVTSGSNYMRQIVAAQAEGAIAAQAIYRRMLREAPNDGLHSKK
ncbi:MAG: FAD-dependent oxidoreductase [Candidatus Woesearchaeota archaeon]